MLIAIDGPAGAGKSTVARALAARLRYAYLDSGAMYRCVALAALQRGRREPIARPGVLGELARSLRIDPGERLLLDGRDVTDAVRTPEVSEMASRVARDPEVRAAMVARQQALLAGGDWVVEGRDIGTVVAPQADLKVFLTASPRERARRRAAELGADADLVLAEQALRDARDEGRAHSPLQAAGDAVELDTTGLSLDDVVESVLELARDRR